MQLLPEPCIPSRTLPTEVLVLAAGPIARDMLPWMRVLWMAMAEVERLDF